MTINKIYIEAKYKIYLLLFLYIMLYIFNISNCQLCNKLTKTLSIHKNRNNISYINRHINNILQSTMSEPKKQCLSNPSTQLYNNYSKFSTNMNKKSFEIPYLNTSEIKIQFTDQESQLIEFLRQCLLHYKLNTVLRIAGGWVRDKILGLNSSDIDIALSDMTGVQFANILSEFNMKHYGKSIGFGVIEKRPEHSKHLETVALQIGGLQVDFVNLRHDSYTCDDNRIPEIRIGTEEEDAYRRDFTINSLFYNINTNQIEDLTCMGLDDLRNGIIRTPLDPIITFLDDPLRVVRAIRFATRFGFKLSDQLIDAASKIEVTNAFMKKVTRSRLSNEIYNILIKSDQYDSFNLLNKFNLLEWLTAFPGNVKYDSDISHLIQNQNWINKGLEYMFLAREIASKHANSLPFASISNEVIDSFYIALLVNKISPIQYQTSKAKPIDLIEYVIKESLKLRKRHYIQSKELNSNAILFNDYINNIDVLESIKSDELGIFIRTCGRYWREAFFINFILYIDENNYQLNLNNIDNYTDKHLKLYNKIIQMGLENAYEIQPKLNGDDIKKILTKITPGAVFKDVILSHMKYILQNPNCTIQEATEHLKTEFKDLL